MAERAKERAAAEAEVVKRLAAIAPAHQSAIVESLGEPASVVGIDHALWRRITQETAQTLYWPLLQTHLLAHNLLWRDVGNPPLDDFGLPLPPQDDLPGRGELQLPPVGPKQDLLARQWATLRVVELAEGLTETVRKRLAATEAELDAAGIFERKSRRAVRFEEDLDELFADPRRIRIAATEITEAISSGELSLAEAIAEANDFGLDAVWHTEEDDRVCPICAPLNEQPSHVFAPLVGFPPAHPVCRCWLNWSVAGIDRRGLAPRRRRRTARKPRRRSRRRASAG